METEAETIAGVVLAGGASSRMGTPKALLRCGPVTFLESLTVALAQGGCKPIMAVLSEPFAQVRTECLLEGVKLVINPDPSLGPISSIRCALDAAPTACGLVVVLVDQGPIKANTVREVRKALKSASVAVARYQGRPGHPTGFYKAVFGMLRSSMADRGARTVVQQEQRANRGCWVDVDDPGVIRNLNNPVQYRKFVRGYEVSR